MKTKNSLSTLFKASLAASMVLGVSSAKATLFDLSTAPLSGVTLADGSIFQINDPHSSTGTGVVDPFLSIQSSPNEQGYNTNAGDFDTKRNGQFTRDLLVGELK